MATDAQINANRENAKKSTGPRTPEGKRAILPNSIKHGLYCAASTLRQLEGGKDFENLIENFRKDIRPHGAIQEALVEQLASMHHRIRRYNQFETFIESKHIILGGDFPTAMARDHNITHNSIPKLANMVARLHREFRATIKTLFEVQEKEPAWLVESYEEREAAGEFKTKPIQYGPEDGEPPSSPRVRPQPRPETVLDPIQFVEKPIK